MFIHEAIAIPQDVNFSILSYLNPKEATKCREVSKLWNQSITTMPNLWKYFYPNMLFTSNNQPAFNKCTSSEQKIYGEISERIKRLGSVSKLKIDLHYITKIDGIDDESITIEISKKNEEEDVEQVQLMNQSDQCVIGVVLDEKRKYVFFDNLLKVNPKNTIININGIYVKAKVTFERNRIFQNDIDTLINNKINDLDHNLIPLRAKIFKKIKKNFKKINRVTCGNDSILRVLVKVICCIFTTLALSTILSTILYNLSPLINETKW